MPIAPPSPEIEEAILASATQITRRIEFYERDAVIPWEYPGVNSRLEDGTVSITGDGDERRSVELTLDNRDQLLKHDPHGGFWYDKIIKVYRGVKWGEGKEWETQIGEFMIDRISVSHFPSVVKITGRDYVKKCLLSKFVKNTAYTESDTLMQTIKAIANNAGVFKMVLPNDLVRLGRTFLFERGTSRWEAMKKMAEAFGYDIFFDAQGYLIMRKFRDPTTSPIVYTFRTGRLGNLVTFEKSTNDSRVFNHIVVYGGEDPNVISPIFAEALNTEPSSPTRIEKMGDRLLEHHSTLITTKAQAKVLADQWLKIYSMEEYELSLESIVIPWLEVQEVVRFEDPNPGTSDPDRFLLSSLTIPLKLGAMSGSMKRIVVVG